MNTIGVCGGEVAQAPEDDEKRMVCAQSRFVRVPVSEVAQAIMSALIKF